MVLSTPRSQTSKIRTDILDNEELTTPLPSVSFEHVYDLFIEHTSTPERLRTLGPAKELDECMLMIQKAIESKEDKEEVIEEARLKYFGWEEPSSREELEAISILPILRLPGVLSGGKVDKGRDRVREIVPHIRQEGVDPSDHNYRTADLGKFYDNWVQFTCWARTNKVAFDRSVWFEDLIEEYAWYFTASGIHRIIVQGTKERLTKKIGDNVIYGFPVEVYISTEKIKTISEKALERIIVKIGLADS